MDIGKIDVEILYRLRSSTECLSLEKIKHSLENTNTSTLKKRLNSLKNKSLVSSRQNCYVISPKGFELFWGKDSISRKILKLLQISTYNSVELQKILGLPNVNFWTAMNHLFRNKFIMIHSTVKIDGRKHNVWSVNDKGKKYLKKPGKQQKSQHNSLSEILSEYKTEISEASKRFNELIEKNTISPGLYYVVLIDLVDSTKKSASLRPEDNSELNNIFNDLVRNALKKPSFGRYSTFVKEIGDASLFLFTNFRDILDWISNADKSLAKYNKECVRKGKPKIYQMKSKICIHMGEVHFRRTSDPATLIVNQLIKISKKFTTDIGITDTVKQAILPRINSKEIKARELSRTFLPQDTVRRSLWGITIKRKK